MGRRALRKLDARLDLSGYLLRLAPPAVPGAAQTDPPEGPGVLAGPIDPQTLFPSPAPLEIEVGSGKGLFLLSASQAHPQRNFLGVELAANYAAYCASRLLRHGSNNARVISGDALRLFRELLPAQCADAVHVYFPDPWWKKRHRKRRVMTPEFVADIERVLKPGGHLHFWTDVEEYFHSTLEIIGSHTRLVGPLPVPEQSPSHDMDYRTNFERRKRQAGLPIYRALFQSL